MHNRKSAMNTKLFFTILFFVPLFGENGFSKEKQPSIIRGAVVETLSSKYVKDMEYKLHITLPPDYSSTEVNYPILFYLDAWMTTGIMNDAYFMTNATN
jgi:hypothetical protein